MAGRAGRPCSRVPASRPWYRLAAERPAISVDWLRESGIEGNGHMMMMEDNNAQIAERIQRWLLEAVPGGR